MVSIENSIRRCLAEGVNLVVTSRPDATRLSSSGVYWLEYRIRPLAETSWAIGAPVSEEEGTTEFRSYQHTVNRVIQTAELLHSEQVLLGWYTDSGKVFTYTDCAEQDESYFERLHCVRERMNFDADMKARHLANVRSSMALEAATTSERRRKHSKLIEAIRPLLKPEPPYLSKQHISQLSEEHSTSKNDVRCTAAAMVRARQRT